MGRKWDQTTCFLCDFWWLILLLLAIIIAAIFGTRNLWLPEPIPTPTSVPTPMSTATLVPTPIPSGFTIPSDVSEAELCPGAEAFYDWQINIPRAAQYTDFLFAFDQTGSMGGVIEDAQEAATQMMELINQSVGDARFGVVGFSDEPSTSTDDSFRIYQPITSDFEIVQEVIDGFQRTVGGDTENYLRVMYESYTNPSIGWRDGGRHIIIFFGDDYPQDPDASIDEKFGTVDDLTTYDTIQEMVQNNMIMIFVYSSDGIEERLLTYWQEKTEKTGGMAVSLSEDTGFAEVINAAVSEVSRHIDELDLEVGPDQYQSWAVAAPVTDITVSDAEELVHMPVTFMVPDGFSDAGRHTIQLVAIGDGADYASMDFVISIPQECIQE